MTEETLEATIMRLKGHQGRILSLWLELITLDPVIAGRFPQERLNRFCRHIFDRVVSIMETGRGCYEPCAIPVLGKQVQVESESILRLFEHGERALKHSFSVIAAEADPHFRAIHEAEMGSLLRRMAHQECDSCSEQKWPDARFGGFCLDYNPEPWGSADLKHEFQRDCSQPWTSRP